MNTCVVYIVKYKSNLVETYLAAWSSLEPLLAEQSQAL